MREIKLVDDNGKVKKLVLLDAESIPVDEEQDMYMIRMTFQCLNCGHKYSIDVEDVVLMAELVNTLNSDGQNAEFNPSELPVDITCPSCTIKMYLN